MTGTQSRWTAIGAALGGLAVILGAFAAHALKTRFAELSSGDFNAREIFDVGARYHAIHALAILFASMAIDRTSKFGRVACWAFLLGIIAFSGSLYLLATTGVRWLGAVTPVGGLAFITGWGFLAIAALRAGNPATPPPSG